MTAPDSGREKTAKALFVGLFGLALGWAGVLVAAVAVAVENTWSGGAVERDRARERRQGWLAGQRAWLDADHQRRVEQANQRQAWLAAGADPTTEPAKPSKAKRLGAAVRRVVAHVAVAGSDFVGGLRDGAAAANDTRKNGGTFRDISCSRPGPVCAQCKRHGIPVVGDGLCADCAAVTAEQQETGQRRTAEPSPRQRCRNCRREAPLGFNGVCADCEQPTAGSLVTPKAEEPLARLAADVDATRRRYPTPIDTCPKCGNQRPITPSGWCEPCTVAGPHRFCDHCKGVMRFSGRQFVHGSGWTCSRKAPPGADHVSGPPQSGRTRQGQNRKLLVHCSVCGTPWLADDLDEHTRWHLDLFVCDPCRDKIRNESEGEPMTSPSQPTSTPTAAESNATVLRGKLLTTRTTLGRIADLTDQLAKERTKLDAQVRDADEFATATGQSSKARQALDESRAVATVMGDRLGEFSQGAVSAEEQMTHASDGLRVAEEAEDSLRQAGADGRAVAPAGTTGAA